jgi:hypothetical protein
MTTVVAPRPLATRHHVLIALGALLSVALVAWGALTLVDLMAHQHEDVHLSFSVPASQVRIRLSSGSVHVVPAAGSTVEVDRHLAWGLSHPHRKEQVVDGVLEITAGCSGIINTYCTTRYDLAVPRTFALQVRSQDGSVRVTGLDGPLDLSSSNGSITADNLGSTDVQAGSSNGSLRLVFAVEPRHVQANSSNGSVTVSVPPVSGPYRVDAHSSNGTTRLDVRTDPQSDRLIVAHSSNGSVTVRAG